MKGIGQRHSFALRFHALLFKCSCSRALQGICSCRLRTVRIDYRTFAYSHIITTTIHPSVLMKYDYDYDYDYSLLINT